MDTCACHEGVIRSHHSTGTTKYIYLYISYSYGYQINYIHNNFILKSKYC